MAVAEGMVRLGLMEVGAACEAERWGAGVVGPAPPRPEDRPPPPSRDPPHDAKSSPALPQPTLHLAPESCNAVSQIGDGVWRPQ